MIDLWDLQDILEDYVLATSPQKRSGTVRRLRNQLGIYHKGKLFMVGQEIPEDTLFADLPPGIQYTLGPRTWEWNERQRLLPDGGWYSISGHIRSDLIITYLP